MKKQVEQILNWNNEQEIEFIKRSIGNEEIVGLLSQKKMKKSEKVNYLLLNNGKDNFHYQYHASIIKSIIEHIFYKNKKKCPDFVFFKNIHDKIFKAIKKPDLTDLSDEMIMELIEKLHFDYLNSEYILQNDNILKNKSKINLREKGAVYTPAKIVDEIVINTFSELPGKIDEKLAVLDFGSGTGRFYFSALRYLERNTKNSKKKIILENLYAIDSDPVAIAILMVKAGMEAKDLSEENFEKLSKRIICRNMLYVDENNTDGINYSQTFKSVFKKDGFDVILSNPPYLVLKATGDKSKIKRIYDDQKEFISKESEYFRKNEFYTTSIQGMLNYYRLSIECILRISNQKAVLGVICPATLFGDTSASNLRKEILSQNQLVKLKYFPENSKLFEQVAQASSIFILNKNNVTDKIEVKNNLSNEKQILDFKLISKIFPELEIPFISKDEWKILKKISQFQKISQIKEIRNRRGELDLSIYKDCITKKNTDYLLVRGINIKEDEIVGENEFVNIKNFVSRKSKEFREKDLDKNRIAGQQIVNIDAEKRLKFAITKPNHILGNSCNYISIEKPLEIEWIKSQLNSYLLNWRFKITSTNNHINNYEIDELPLTKKAPKKFTKKLTELQKNILICKSFELNLKEIKLILKNYFKETEINQNHKEMFN